MARSNRVSDNKQNAESGHEISWIAIVLAAVAVVMAYLMNGTFLATSIAVWAILFSLWPLRNSRSTLNYAAVVVAALALGATTLSRVIVL